MRDDPRAIAADAALIHDEMMKRLMIERTFCGE